MNKYVKLGICLIVDLIGMFSFIIPGVGEITDVAWAPISSAILLVLFGKKNGSVGAVINLAEELSLGFDFIPTLTLNWMYVHLKKEEKTNKQ